MPTWSELFKQLVHAYLAKKIGEAMDEGLKNAERICRDIRY